MNTKIKRKLALPKSRAQTFFVREQKKKISRARNTKKNNNNNRSKNKPNAKREKSNAKKSPGPLFQQREAKDFEKVSSQRCNWPPHQLERFPENLRKITGRLQQSSGIFVRNDYTKIEPLVGYLVYILGELYTHIKTHWLCGFWSGCRLSLFWPFWSNVQNVTSVGKRIDLRRWQESNSWTWRFLAYGFFTGLTESIARSCELLIYFNFGILVSRRNRF